MWISTAATVVNVLLDYLLVFGKLGLPRMEVAGAALATIIVTYFFHKTLYFVFIGLFINYFLLSFIYAIYLKDFLLKKGTVNLQN